MASVPGTTAGAAGGYQSEPSRSCPGWKIFLRVFSIVTAGISAGMGIYSAVSSSFSPLAAAVAPTGLAIVWDLADLITVCASRNRDGIHPAASVGVDFAILAACAGVAGYAGSVLSPVQDECNTGCDDDTGNLLVNLYVLIAFLCATILVHVGLFIMGCVQLTKRSNAAAAPVAPAMNQPAAGTGLAGVPQYIMLNGQLVQVVPVEKSGVAPSPAPQQQGPTAELQPNTRSFHEVQSPANAHEMYNATPAYELHQP